MLVEHEKSRQQSQKRMNEEINNLRNNIKEVWSRIGAYDLILISSLLIGQMGSHIHI